MHSIKRIFGENEGKLQVIKQYLQRRLELFGDANGGIEKNALHIFFKEEFAAPAQILTPAGMSDAD